MCQKCEDLRRQLAATRLLSTELTDPSSIALNKADIKALEEYLIRSVAQHCPVTK
jgi:hypothetical protein